MCQSCEVVRINGALCHEQGCPDAWRDYKIECQWCGNSFVPEERYQKFCDESCHSSFYGWAYDEEFDEEIEE